MAQTNKKNNSDTIDELNDGLSSNTIPLVKQEILGANALEWMLVRHVKEVDI